MVGPIQADAMGLMNLAPKVACDLHVLSIHKHDTRKNPTTNFASHLYSGENTVIPVPPAYRLGIIRT